MNKAVRSFLKASVAALTVAAVTLPAFAQPTPSQSGPTSTGPSVSPAPFPTPSHDPKAPGGPGGPPTLMPGSAAGPGFSPNSPFPAGSSPLSPPTVTLPKYLEGVITLEQLQTLMKFQQQINEDPESTELIAKLKELTAQVRQLQGELTKHRTKAITDNPEMKAIADKMQEAMRSHSSMPFMPPGANPGAPMPGRPGPVPASGPPGPAPTPPSSTAITITPAH